MSSHRNEADRQIMRMIDRLASEHGRFLTTAEEKAAIVDQIAKLRSSMNPTDVQSKD